MATKEQLLDGEPGVECQDCGRADLAEHAGEAPFPRACRVCGGANFKAINGYEPVGTRVDTGTVIEASAEDAGSTTDSPG